jgi:hypothetical protein
LATTHVAGSGEGNPPGSRDAACEACGCALYTPSARAATSFARSVRG